MGPAPKLFRLARVYCSVLLFSRTSVNQSLLTMSGSLIQQQQTGFSDFQPTLLAIITWNDVGHYNFSNNLTNTFQSVLVTNGSSSFVMFCYSSLQWAEFQPKLAQNILLKYVIQTNNTDIEIIMWSLIFVILPYRALAGYATSSHSMIFSDSNPQALISTSNVNDLGVFLYNTNNAGTIAVVTVNTSRVSKQRGLNVVTRLESQLHRGNWRLILLVQNVTMDMSEFVETLLAAHKAGWRCAVRGHGVLCAMTFGIHQMPRWCASRQDSLK